MQRTSVYLLLVEDNPDDAELISELLADIAGLAVQVDHANRISEAIALLGQHAHDVVLLDLSLPDAQGMAALERLRAVNPAVPIVILTGANDETLAQEAARAGAQDYLVKGKVDAELLGRTLGYALERARTSEELRRHRDHLEEVVEQRTAELRRQNALLELEIQQRVEAEAQMRRLSTAIQHAAEAIVVTAVDGTLEYVNPAFEQMSGYAKEEVLGRNMRQIQSGQHPKAFYQSFWDTILGRGTWHGQFINKRKDGRLFTCECTVSSVADATGAICNFVGVSRDVTDEIKIREQLNRSQRMDSIGQLAGGIAHDFNNVLQAVFGYASLCLSEVPEDSVVHANLAELLQAAERASTLTRQILAFSRKQIIKRHPCSLNQVVDGTQKMLARLLGENIQLEYLPGADLGLIEADPGQLEQILVNLCINARDATAGAGVITIETMRLTIDETYLKTHPWARAGDFAVLAVSDQGSGMPPEVVNRIFEPFFTTKPEGQGTGLGLSTVYGIVKQHEGFLQCYSEVGRGTIFRVYLPCTDRTVVPITKQVTAPAAGGQETILVAEDDEAVRTLAKIVLSRAGYTVLTSPDGQTALALIRSTEHIDLLFTDVIMPNLGGLELIEQIAGEKGGLPVLLSSGYSPRSVSKSIANNHLIDVLQKPYSSEDLLRKVRSLLDVRQGQR